MEHRKIEQDCGSALDLRNDSALDFVKELCVRRDGVVRRRIVRSNLRCLCPKIATRGEGVLFSAGLSFRFSSKCSAMFQTFPKIQKYNNHCVRLMISPKLWETVTSEFLKNLHKISPIPLLRTTGFSNKNLTKSAPSRYCVQLDSYRKCAPQLEFLLENVRHI